MCTRKCTAFYHRRGGLCIEEKLVHLTHILHFDRAAARKLGQNRRWREQLQCISARKRGDPISLRLRLENTITDRSELFSPSVANRSTTPGPNFSPSIFARNCTTLLICSRV